MAVAENGQVTDGSKGPNLSNAIHVSLENKKVLTLTDEKHLILYGK